MELLRRLRPLRPLRLFRLFRLFRRRRRSPGALGRRAERRAARYLQRRGLRVLARNLRTPAGEIDLVCEDPGTACLIFVEVRCVASRGGPTRAVDAVTPAKARQVGRAATSWLSGRAARRLGACDRPIRFDVVGVDARSGALEHIEDAFTSAWS